MLSEARYTIGAVARLTGVTTETLRAWERRYQLVVPGRDDRGRAYSDEDVHKLRLLHELVGRGHPIGRLARLSMERLEELRLKPLAVRPDLEIDRAPLSEALVNFDAAALDRELGRLATLLSPRDFALSVAIPFLHEVGEGWQLGQWSVAQEHLASVAMRTVLGSLVRLSLLDSRPRMLFAAPSGERHEFGLLGAALLAASSGIPPLFLGVDLPVEDIGLAADRTGAWTIVLSTVGAVTPDETLSQVKKLVARMPRGFPIWTGGATGGFASALAKAGATCLSSLEEFDGKLAASSEAKT